MNYFDQLQGNQQDYAPAFDASNFTNQIQQLLASQQQQPDPMNSAMQQQQAIPGLPEKIVQALGGSAADTGGSAQDMLSARFNTEPSYGDYAQSLASTMNGKFASPQDSLIERLKAMGGVTKDVAIAQAGGIKPGATMQAFAVIKAAHPELDDMTALSMAQKGVGMGNTYSDGQITNIAGAPQAAGSLEFGKKMGEQNAIIGTSAEIERQKKIGSGDITQTQALDKGRAQVSDMIGKVSASYDQLNQAGGITNPKNSTLENIGAYVGNTGVGQAAGKMAGTNTQSIRNQIEQSRPLLINAIRQATGMSAKSMDSNAELQFYLKAATDPKLDIGANKVALQRLEELYGLSAANLGGGAPTPISAPPQGGKLIGTSGGKAVYQLPDGSHVMEQ